MKVNNIVKISDLKDNEELIFTGKQIKELKEFIEKRKYKQILRLIKKFEPTKSNMMYDEVLYELEKQMNNIK